MYRNKSHHIGSTFIMIVLITNKVIHEKSCHVMHLMREFYINISLIIESF